MYCRKCGAELKDGDIFCPKCGQKVEEEVHQETVRQEVVFKRQRDESLCNVGFIFCVIGTVVMGFAIIPLIWCIPMTIYVYNAIKDKKPMSVGLKVCVLLFVSLIGGIFLLLGDPDE